MTGKGTQRGSGDGWAKGPGDTKVWGLFGAAGLFLVAGGENPRVLLQHRAAWTNLGDTWGIPGGAVDREETAVEGALRETFEECGIDPQVPEVLTSMVTAGPFPGDDWTYTTVIARVPEPVDTQANEESYELRWVELSQLKDVLSGGGPDEELVLLEPFRKSLPRVLAVAEGLLAQ
ncbi:NTP pyrophosphohydrolase [Corynebacterium phocae]|uniref:NTP pyrophosphohydrolase n=1 Tax=Corynebacterium phocae TaxID=161895 RepID=A0A1L7D5U5_9CORY|nr:NUDIX hydrolase [Corynebacterium phocae]APT93312.1 NTP pyrophosphohydrolase [Corynebacterium phocae]KAA8721644.1 NUDIX hydrolase [Corynebacterium phocae]